VCIPIYGGPYQKTGLTALSAKTAVIPCTKKLQWLIVAYT